MNLKFTLPLLFATLSAGAFADGPYVVGEVTHSNLSLNKNQLNSDLVNAGAVGLHGSTDGNGNQWRLQGGYQFTTNVAVEAGYIDLGEAKYKASFTGGSAKGNQKAGGVDLAVLGIVPVTDNFSVFGKAGVVAAKVKAKLDSTAPAAVTGSDSFTQVRPLLGVGATYSIQKNLELRLDLDRVTGLGKSSSAGKMDDNMASIGIAYRF